MAPSVTGPGAAPVGDGAARRGEVAGAPVRGTQRPVGTYPRCLRSSGTRPSRYRAEAPQMPRSGVGALSLLPGETFHRPHTKSPAAHQTSLAFAARLHVADAHALSGTHSSVPRLRRQSQKRGSPARGAESRRRTSRRFLHTGAAGWCAAVRSIRDRSRTRVAFRPRRITVRPMRTITRLTQAMAGAALALALQVTGSAAGSYGNAPWCAVQNLGAGDVVWDCEFPSAAACAPFVVAGNRGFCNANPRWTPLPPAAPELRRHWHHRHYHH